MEGNHGATIGRLDEDSVFYMQSRGYGFGKAPMRLMAESQNGKMLFTAFPIRVFRHILRRLSEERVRKRNNGIGKRGIGKKIKRRFSYFQNSKLCLLG